MKKIKLLLIVALVFITVNILKAQEEFNPGTLYSAFGVGDIRYSASLRTDAMGIQGIGLFGNYINNLNPASNTHLRTTMVTIGMNAIMLKTSNEFKSEKFSDASAMGFNLGIPVWQPYGLVLLLGFNPQSAMQYKITGTVNQNGTTFTETFAGHGGLSRLNFGIAGKPLRFLNIGAEYNYSFGNIKELAFFNFNSSSIINTFIKSENDLKGSYFKTGAVIELGSLFTRNKVMENLNIGFFYQSKLNLNSRVDMINFTTLGFDTSNSTYPNVEVPESYGFGISKQLGRQLIVSSDILFQKYSKFKSSSSLPANYADNFRFGVGFEVLPMEAGSERSFLGSFTYRAGFSYDNSIFKLKNEYVNNYAVNLGIGIPLNNENAIDLGVTVGTRGKTDLEYRKG